MNRFAYIKYIIENSERLDFEGNHLDSDRFALYANLLLKTAGRHGGVTPGRVWLFGKDNSKMKGSLTFSLPAGPKKKGGSCLGHHSGPGSICDKCYADPNGKSYYQFHQDLRQRRLQALSEEYFVDEALKQLVHEINKKRSNNEKDLYVRLFDSGDFDSIQSIYKWIDIVKKLNTHISRYGEEFVVHFWIPTRTWHIGDLDKGAILNALRTLQKTNELPHIQMAVRPSALNFGDPAPRIEGLASGATSKPLVMKGKAFTRKHGRDALQMPPIDQGDEVSCPAAVGEALNKSRRRLGIELLPHDCTGAGCTECWEGIKNIKYHQK